MSGSNNLGRTETQVNQENKEASLNASDAILDAAISNALEIVWTGSDTLKTISDAQLQQNVAFRMTGTPGADPVFKFAAVQRGLIVIVNELAVALDVQDYTSATTYTIPAGGSSIVYVSSDFVAGLLASDGIPDAPADGTTYGRKDNAWEPVATAYGTENAQDDIAAMIAAGVHAGVNITYDDAGNAISFSVVGTIDYQESVRIAATSNLTLSGEYTTQSVALVAGDRVLAAGQTAAEDRRIWIVASGAWTIAEGWDSVDTITSGTVVPVDEGTNAGTIFQLTTPDTIVLGVTALSWASNAKAVVSNYTIRSVKGSPYTPTAAMTRHLFNLDSGSTTQVFNVPTNASVKVPVGSEWLVCARTTGTKSIVAAGTVSINGTAGATLSFSSRYDAWLLKKRAANDWLAWPLVTSAASAYTDEQARDAIAALIAAGTHGSGLTFTYNDGSDTLSLTYNQSTMLDSIGSTRGQILYRGASGWAALSPGTAGQMLQTGGAGADPSWASASSYTDENAQDAIAALFAAGTHSSGVTFTYTDGSDKLELTLAAATLLEQISSTQGSILYRNGSAWVALAPGTAGQVLQSGGAGANPSWTSAASGYTDEQAQDAIAAMLAAGTHTNITVTYNDGSNSMSLALNTALTGGFTSSSYNLGTVTSGTVTPDPTNGNLQHMTANGAFTLAVPTASGEYTIAIEVLNGASAGAISTSGFTKVNGDSYATTNGNKYIFQITKHKNYSLLTIVSLN